MNETGGDNLNSSIEKLINRIEYMCDRQAAEAGATENVIQLLDRLSLVLSRMEDGKNFEADLIKKIDLLNRGMERTINMQEKFASGRNGQEGTLEKAINGARVVGMILTTLANSVQATVESINTVLNKNPGAADEGREGTRAARTQADLTSILQPVSTLVKSMVEERLKQQEAAAGSGLREKPEAEAPQ